jgi:biopolymer transport protein ExbD
MPRLMAEIHFAPWVDLMLMVLLAFLVIPTAWLPDTSTGAGPPGPRIELVASADLRLTLDGKPVEQQALIPELTRMTREKSGLGVVVVIPQGMSAANLLLLMDALRQAGVRHTAVTSRPASP